MSIADDPKRGTSIRDLARAHGVETAYQGAHGGDEIASDEVLSSVLRALGVPIERATDAPDLLRLRERELWERALEPVIVVWDGSPLAFALRMSERARAARVDVHVEFENGNTWSARIALQAAPVVRTHVADGCTFVERAFAIDAPFMLGYHRLIVEAGAQRLESRVICAPVRAHLARSRARARPFGVFVPLYALHSKRSFGAGDLTDLEKLAEWSAARGASFVATLPLLAAFLDRPCEPSPYSPASRLFWNEFYLDVPRIEEWQRCSAARARLASARAQRELTALQSARAIDYPRAMRFRRALLEDLAASFFGRTDADRSDFDAFVRAKPAVEDYARFRATCEQLARPWGAWPRAQREGRLARGDYDERARLYHLFVQWQAQRQIATVAARARAHGQGLLLDLPIGVHSDGYDVWRERASFALQASAGAPPDAFFTAGQDWGFPPLHPERIRADGYRYFIEVVRHHFAHASFVRLDHVMGLHRLYWVPRGCGVRQGAYVRYRSEESYAILALESARSKTTIVGEDLGTVPREMRPAMARHRVLRTYVLEAELSAESDAGLAPVPSACLATIETHDMLPFAAFWRATDLRERTAQGTLDAISAKRERASRAALKRSLIAGLRRAGVLATKSARRADVLHASLAWLGASLARAVVVNLEDTWGETQAQNVPGTTRGEPNWKRKTRYGFEELVRRTDTLAALAVLERARRSPAQRELETRSTTPRSSRARSARGGASR